MKRRLFIIGILVVGLAFFVITLRYWSWQGRLIKGNGYEGIVITHLPKYFNYKVDTLKITDIDIQSLESTIKTYLLQKGDTLISKELPKYFRKYYPIIYNQQHCIKIQFDHERSGLKRLFWLHVPYTVAGGGYFFWSVTYNKETCSFSNFKVNLPE